MSKESEDANRDLLLEAEAINIACDIEEAKGFIRLNKTFERICNELILNISRNAMFIFKCLLFDILASKDNSITKKNRKHKKNYRGDEIDDSKRIFCLKVRSREEVASFVFETKYRDAADDHVVKKSIRDDVSKGLKFLDNNNIMYVWKCVGHYIFYMEKNFTYWKPFNSNAYLTPSVILKLINQSESQIGLMVKKREIFVKGKIQKSLVRQVADDSYVLDFVMGNLKKMDPDVSKELLSIEYDGDREKYIKCLEAELNMMKLFSGYRRSECFWGKIPLTVATAIGVSEDSLRKVYNIESKIVDGKGIENDKVKAKFIYFDEKEEPFSSGKALVAYYENKVKLTKRGGYCSLKTAGQDIVDASELLERIKDTKYEDIDFLNGWISYYVDNHLKGEKCGKRKFTSFDAFASTFKTFDKLQVCD